uniref:LysM domain-containing protein n=1 Tax=Psilocybe cubensis TaxID=181762 RepID=A0A8H8CDS6_PSICU
MSSVFLRLLAVSAIAYGAILSNVQGSIPDCARTYTVQLGDFCDKISAQQNVSTFQLASVNNGIIDAGCDNLVVGEVLCLGLIGHDCTDVHVVVEGDTCESIALESGSSISAILSNNPNVNSECTNIGIGEVTVGFLSTNKPKAQGHILPKVLCVAPTVINSTNTD